MENEILDFENEEHNNTSIYANRSIIFLLVSIGIITLLFVFVYFEASSYTSYRRSNSISGMIALTILVSSIIGLINGILSFIKLEDAILKKSIGTIGNLILIVFFSSFVAALINFNW